MRDSRLVGREHAVQVLSDVVAEGRAATVGISGAAGTGRTALLEWLLAARPGALASCVPDGIPFGAVTQLAAALLPPARFADLLADCLDDRPRAAGRWCDAFARLATERPLVLAVDDLQWADEWSVRWFEEMTTRVDDGPVLLVATAYEPLALDHQLALQPLTAAETAVLAHRVLGEPASAEVLDIVRGRPAVLHDLAARWDAGHVAEVGRAVTSARAARVRRGLPPDALALLRAMAVSDQLDAGLPSSAALEASGLVANGKLAEPHLAADVLAEMPKPERDELYRRSAELAHRTGAGALVTAGLLRKAPPVGEPWARMVLVEAAKQLSVQGDSSAAAESLRRALAEPAEPSERAALLVRLASAELRLDPDRADRRLAQVLTEGLPAVVTAADHLLARGDAETVHRLVAESGRKSIVDPALTALGWLAREDATVEPEIPVPPLPDLGGSATPESASHGTEVAGSATPASGPAIHTFGVAAPHVRRRAMPAPEASVTEPRDPAEAGVAAFRLAVRGEDRLRVLDLAERAFIVREDAPLIPRIAACRALLWAGSAVDAAEGLSVVVTAARRRDARAAAAQALVHRAGAALRDDRPDDALRDLAAAERELPARCWHPAAVPTWSAVEIAAHLRLGRLGHARKVAAERLPRGGGRGAPAALLLHAEAELALAGDDPKAALAAALECGRVLRSRGWVNPMPAPWRTTAGLALRRLGDGDGAANLLAEELRLADRWGTAAALETLRDRAAVGLRRVVPTPRRPADPVPKFPPSRPGALSPVERDVAELAARGLPNREIARELSIAVRTVELRLTKVYRKLGIKGRSALSDQWTG